jgi:pilus assembly protein Flp/PilA
LIKVLLHSTNDQRSCAVNSAIACNLKTPIHTTLGFMEHVTTAETHRASQSKSSGLEAKLKHKILKFLADESGATAIEYGLIAAGISLAIIAIVNGLGTNLNNQFTSINTSLK